MIPPARSACTTTLHSTKLHYTTLHYTTLQNTTHHYTTTGFSNMRYSQLLASAYSAVCESRDVGMCVLIPSVPWLQAFYTHYGPKGNAAGQKSIHNSRSTVPVSPFTSRINYVPVTT